MRQFLEAVSLEDLTNEYMRYSIMSGDFGSLEKMIARRIARQEMELNESKRQLAAIIKLTSKQEELPVGKSK